MKVPDNFLYYLGLHKDCSLRDLSLAKELNPTEVELLSRPDVVRIKKMVYSVMNEAHKMRGFVRLKPLGRCILYGYLKPQHRIGLHVASSLAKRFPLKMILLGNNQESFAAFYFNELILARGAAINSVVKNLQNTAGFEGVELDKVWEVYYSSQFSPERKNAEAFRRHMPNKFLKSAGLHLEGQDNKVTLNDFL